MTFPMFPAYDTDLADARGAHPPSIGVMFPTDYSFVDKR